MSAIGQSPALKRARLTPQSADPGSPAEGDLFYADGTSRSEGLYLYTDGAWLSMGGQNGSYAVGSVDISSNGNWLVPAGITSCLMEVYGGGGGGGSGTGLTGGITIIQGNNGSDGGTTSVTRALDSSVRSAAPGQGGFGGRYYSSAGNPIFYGGIGGRGGVPGGTGTPYVGGPGGAVAGIGGLGGVQANGDIGAGSGTGGGGGGGRLLDNGGSGGGGGSGQFASYVLTDLVPGELFAIIIGVGGAAGTAPTAGWAGGPGIAGRVRITY